MHIPKKYIHDKLALFLLSTDVFLAALCSVLVLLRVGIGGSVEGYIVEYRPSLGLNAFHKAGALPIIAFVIFPIMVLVIHGILSIKLYTTHRILSVTILSLGIVLLVAATIVSNALLSLY